MFVQLFNRQINYSVGQGTFSINGMDVPFLKDYTLSVNSGSLNVNGQDSILSSAYEFLVNAGSILVDGKDATLIETNKYDLSVSGGTYSINGENTILSLLSVYDLMANGGAYSINGSQVMLLDTDEYAVMVDPGTISINGTSATLSASSSAIGINMDQTIYFSKSRIYEDWGKTASFYYNNSSPATMNSGTGFPISGDTSLTIHHSVGETWISGNYTLAWDGGGSGPTSKTLNPGDNTENYNFSGDLSGFTFTRDDAEGIYTPDFNTLATCSNIIRYMDAWRTNISEYEEDHPWVRITVGATNTFYHKLITPRDIVNITNDFACRPWVCMHHLSDSDHWDEVAGILNDCSGEVIVEHSNEHWNSAFPQYQYAKGIYASLGYTAGEFSSIMAYHLDRTNDIGIAFHAVNPTKFVVTFGAQFRNQFTWTTAKNNQMTNHNDVDAIAIGPYQGGPWARSKTPAEILALTHEQIIDEARADWEDYSIDQINDWLTIGSDDSKRILSYEGPSTHLENGDGGSADDWLFEAANSSYGGTFETEMLTWWKANVGDYACVYRDTGNDDAWAYKPYALSSPGSPRYQSWLAEACNG